MNPWDDRDRLEGTLTRVTPGEKFHEVTSSNGWSCSVGAEHGCPAVGDAFVTWGQVGRPIRGMALNGRVLFYRTPEEQADQDAKDLAAMRAERVAKYEGQRHDYDRRVEALPMPLRQRVEGFRRRGGDEWRWDFEPYELMCCEQAAAMVHRFRSATGLAAFLELGHEEQRASFPEMDPGHSGNSWGAAAMLARLLLSNPEGLARQHGALCPLVGCRDYHCWATAAPSGAP